MKTIVILVDQLYNHGGIEKVSVLFKKIKYRNVLAILGVAVLIVLHGVVPNFVIAPFTALGFIFLFLQLKLGAVLNNLLDFFNTHSTNIWLIHMFIYLIYFKDIIYAPKYPVLIFTWLVLWCIAASYLVNFIYAKLEKVFL